MMSQVSGSEIYAELVALYKDKAEKEEALGKVGKEIGTDTVVYDVVKKSLEDTNSKIAEKLSTSYAIYKNVSLQDQMMKDANTYKGGKW